MKKPPFITPTCGHPSHREPLRIGEINYTAQQINELLSLIPDKADKKDIFPNDSYLGHFPMGAQLPDMDRFAWAFVGDLDKAHPYFYYPKSNVPQGYQSGWNDMAKEFGTYLLTPGKQDQLTAEELFKEKFRLPELTADRAIADEQGNRITDTYVKREAVVNHIKQIYNQQFLDNPPLITEGYITPEMLSEETKQMLENTGQTISNLPDGEDLQSVHGVLKLADKQYNPNSYSGLGRRILRKNIVAGVNVLTQSMMQWPNTIYVIQYDYDLQGETITVPEGCVLKFEGGMLSNGEIVGNNTSIYAGVCTIFNNIACKGTLLVDTTYAEWFGAKGDGLNDDTVAIQKAISCFDSVSFLDKTYYIKDNLIINAAKTLKGKGYQNTTFLIGGGIAVTTNNNCNISDINFEADDNVSSDYLLYVNAAYHVHIENCCFYGKNKSAKVGVKYYGKNNTYYHVIDKNRFVELENAVILSYNVNGTTLSDNEFYLCDVCVTIDSCNGNRIINNNFQSYILKAVDLHYNGYGSETWGNIIEGNYFEGVFETATADIDFNNNPKCRNNYIIGNKSTYIAASYGNEHRHIRNCVTSNVIINSTGSTYLYANKLTGFVANEIIPDDYFNAFLNEDLLGCITPRKKEDGSIEYWACVKTAAGAIQWQKVILSNKWGNGITIGNVEVQEIIQYDGGYIKLGRNATKAADRLTLDGSYGALKLCDSKGENWKYIQEIRSFTTDKRPSYYPAIGYCIFDTTLNKPIWWTGTKWVDATGAEV